MPIVDVKRIDDGVNSIVLHGIKQLQTQSSLITQKLKAKKFELIGARYNLHYFKISLFK